MKKSENLEQEIKNDIAEYFLSDSRQYLSRYTLLKPIQTEISNRSKLLIDIVFSFECSLKAIIFLESNLNEKETFKIIKKCSHNLKCLIGKIKSTEIIDITECIAENFEHLSISSRYTLDANMNFRNQVGALDNQYYSTIADPNWLENLYKKAKDLYEYVNSKVDNTFKIISLEDINIDKELEKTNRLRNINVK